MVNTPLSVTESLKRVDSFIYDELIAVTIACSKYSSALQGKRIEPAIWPEL